MRTTFGSNGWKHLAAWPVIAAMAVLNGVVREKVYLDSIGEEAAHRVSTFPLIAAIFGVAFFVAWRWPLRTARQAWAMGLTWVAITEAFEFGLGRLEGRSWGELFHEYNLFAGRIWILALVATFTAPAVAWHLFRPGRESNRSARPGGANYQALP
ncbi:MAG: hypothetical protein AB7N24_00595 [Dehalococcoidia bacterium]